MPDRLTIVGGTYRERCLWPSTDQLRGSGLRAAGVAGSLALAESNLPPVLITWLSSEEVEEAEILAASMDFELHAQGRQTSIAWQYPHALAAPTPFPLVSDVEVSEPVQAEAVLVFDTVEAEPIINAETIIYDPQGGRQPDRFHDLRSRCETFGVVLNLREALRILEQEDFSPTSEDDYREVSKSVAEALGADLVVIKDMTAGAFTLEQGIFGRVCSYETTSVFPIGSGDTFSAAFAYNRTVGRRSAVEAAKHASLSAAYYVSTRSEAIAANLLAFESQVEKAGTKANANTIYLAGPFFTLAERWLVEEVRSALVDQGFCVFSPIHDVGLTSGSPESMLNVAKKDLALLKKSDMVFALLDYYDAGTIFELGWARQLEKPVIAYGEHVDNHQRTMVEGSGCFIFSDLPTAIYKAGWMARR